MASDGPAPPSRLPPEPPRFPSPGLDQPPVLGAAAPPPRPLAAPNLFAGRLHPLTLAILAFNALRNFAIPGLIVLFTGQERSLGIMLLGFLGFHLFFALVRYFTFRYRIDGGELITSEGLLERRERNIPLSRVQDLRLEQGLLHRFLGVVDVNVETAGGSGAEATLSVLSRSEADALRRAVFGTIPSTLTGRSGAVPEAAQTLYTLTWRDLILEGLTASRGTSALILLAASWQFLDDLLPGSVRARVASTLSTSAERWFLPGGETNWGSLVALVLLLLAASSVFSILGAVLLFYGFRLERRGEDLSRSYGLLTRRLASIPRRRIQVLQIEETWLRRSLDLATVRADTAGSRATNEGTEQRGGRDVLLPMVRGKDLRLLLPVLLPALDRLPNAWERVHRCAIRRGTTVGTVVCALVATVGCLASHQLWPLWVLTLTPLILVANVQAYRHGGYNQLDCSFCTRRGWINRSTHVVPFATIQALVIRQTPLDRRHGVHSLLVDTAGQTHTGGGPHLRNLTTSKALALARDLAQCASRTRYRT